MRRPLVSLAAATGLAALAAAAPAATQGESRPAIEPNFAAPLTPPRPCALEGNDRYERRIYRLEGWKAPRYERYPGACERLKFAYGPILVKPGQNDSLVGPVTIEKPMRDGYVTRFKPNLVYADGTVPPVERIHLHHGVWLSAPSYGNSTQFAAAGEEKTIATAPRGYGMPVEDTDQWLMLHMVHSAVPQTHVVWITYDIDFIPKAKARRLGIKDAYPLWLDVRPSGYPVFNVQQRYGGRDRKCTWPTEECAAFDPWGDQFVGQGEPGAGTGTGYTFPARGDRLGRIRSFTGGTLIGLAGHLHPGGLSDNVSLVRGRKSRRIFTSEAWYWKRRKPGKRGGPPTSWDFSMTGTALPYWGIRVRPRDTVRISATYDTRHQSTYEDMGIAVGFVAPDRSDGRPTAPGMNPFKARRDRSAKCWKKTGGLEARRPKTRRRPARRPVLCDKGIPTHGALGEVDTYGGPSGEWTAGDGARTSNVTIANFQYRPGDLSGVNGTGVPTVRLGESLRFTNLDGLSIYHTITTCGFPCLGTTGAAFPLADGRTSTGRQVELDSGELGIGVPEISPAKQTLNWDVPVTREAGCEPGETVSYFCRIHPFMRGAFKVTR